MVEIGRGCERRGNAARRHHLLIISPFFSVSLPPSLSLSFSLSLSLPPHNQRHSVRAGRAAPTCAAAGTARAKVAPGNHTLENKCPSHPSTPPPPDPARPGSRRRPTRTPAIPGRGRGCRSSQPWRAPPCPSRAVWASLSVSPGQAGTARARTRTRTRPLRLGGAGAHTASALTPRLVPRGPWRSSSRTAPRARPGRRKWCSWKKMGGVDFFTHHCFQCPAQPGASVPPPF